MYDFLFPPGMKGLKGNSHCVKFRIKMNKFMKPAAVSHAFTNLIFSKLSSYIETKISERLENDTGFA